MGSFGLGQQRRINGIVDTSLIFSSCRIIQHLDDNDHVSKVISCEAHNYTNDFVTLIYSYRQASPIPASIIYSSRQVIYSYKWVANQFGGYIMFALFAWYMLPPSYNIAHTIIQNLYPDIRGFLGTENNFVLNSCIKLVSIILLLAIY